MTQLQSHTTYQGDTATLDFLVQAANGGPLDLTGTSIRWAMSDPDEIAVPILTKSIGSGVTITSAALGRCTVSIPAGQINTPGSYIHELEVTMADGSTYTVGQGVLIVKPTVYPT